MRSFLEQTRLAFSLALRMRCAQSKWWQRAGFLFGLVTGAFSLTTLTSLSGNRWLIFLTQAHLGLAMLVSQTVAFHPAGEYPAGDAQPTREHIEMAPVSPFALVAGFWAESWSVQLSLMAALVPIIVFLGGLPDLIGINLAIYAGQALAVSLWQALDVTRPLGKAAQAGRSFGGLFMTGLPLLLSTAYASMKYLPWPPMLPRPELPWTWFVILPGYGVLASMFLTRVAVVRPQVRILRWIGLVTLTQYILTLLSLHRFGQRFWLLLRLSANNWFWLPEEPKETLRSVSVALAFLWFGCHLFVYASIGSLGSKLPVALRGQWRATLWSRRSLWLLLFTLGLLSPVWLMWQQVTPQLWEERLVECGGFVALVMANAGLGAELLERRYPGSFPNVYLSLLATATLVGRLFPVVEFLSPFSVIRHGILQDHFYPVQGAPISLVLMGSLAYGALLGPLALACYLVERFSSRAPSPVPAVPRMPCATADP